MAIETWRQEGGILIVLTVVYNLYETPQAGSNQRAFQENMAFTFKLHFFSF